MNTYVYAVTLRTELPAWVVDTWLRAQLKLDELKPNLQVYNESGKEL